MHRVVAFYEWQGQAGHCSGEDYTIIHGVTAYAEKQAHLCKHLAQSCVASWLPALKGNSATLDWEAHYLSMPVAAEENGDTSDGDSEVVDAEGAGEIGGDEKEGNSEDENNLEIDLFELEN
jgi:hypothetical protein